MKNVQEKVQLTVEESKQVSGGFSSSFNLASFRQPSLQVYAQVASSLSTLKPVSGSLSALQPVKGLRF